MSHSPTFFVLFPLKKKKENKKPEKLRFWHRQRYYFLADVRDDVHTSLIREMQSGKWIRMFHAIPQIRSLRSIVRHGTVDNYGCDKLSNRGRKMIETFLQIGFVVCVACDKCTLLFWFVSADFAKSDKRFEGEVE